MKKIFILGLCLLSSWGIFAQDQTDPEVTQDPKVQ
jgi:hypothetical protein